MSKLDLTILVCSLAMLIMSSIILGSANNLDDNQGTKKTDIQRTSTILLIISLGALLVSGFKVYMEYGSPLGKLSALTSLIGGRSASSVYYF